METFSCVFVLFTVPKGIENNELITWNSTKTQENISVCTGPNTKGIRFRKSPPWKAFSKASVFVGKARQFAQLFPLVCGAVFATQGREENICHVWYFWPRKADSSPCTVNVWIGLILINQLANEIGLLAHVISKLKMAEFFKFWTSVQDGGRRQAKRQDGTNSTFSSSFSSKNPSHEI